MSRFFSSIKTRIVFFIILVFSSVLFFILWGGTKLQSEIINSYESQSTDEQKHLVKSIIRDESDSLVSYMKLWLYEENIAPLLENSPDLESWENNVFTLGNQIAVRWFVTSILTYDIDCNLIYNFNTKLKKNKLEYDLVQIKGLVDNAIADEKIVSSFTKSGDGEPYIINIIPSRDEDGDISHFHAVIMRFKTILSRFYKSTGYFSEINLDNFNLKSQEKWPLINMNSSSRFTDSQNNIYLFRSLTFEEFSEKIGQNFQMIVYPNVTELTKGINSIEKTISKMVGGVFLGSIFLLFVIVLIMLAPIDKILNVISRVNKGDYDNKVDYISKSEIGILAFAFNGMLGTIKENIKNINQKNRDIQTILSNINQGILTIDSNLIVNSEYSKNLEIILERENLSDANAIDILFPNGSIGSDEKSRIENSLKMSEDLLSFEINEGSLISNYTLELSSHKKEIEIEFIPISQDEDQVDKILISIKDVTEWNQLKNSMKNNSEQIEIINQILNIPIERFKSFLKLSLKNLKNVKELIKSDISWETDRQASDELFRKLHTLKGNVRGYQLSFLVDSVHNAETIVQNYRNDKEPTIDKHNLYQSIKDIENIIYKYSYIFENKILSLIDENKISSPFDSSKIYELSEFFEKNKEKIYSNNILALDNLKNKIELASSISVKHAVNEVTANISATCASLNILEPVILQNNFPILIYSYKKEILNNILVHLINNSLFHGFKDSVKVENQIYIYFSKKDGSLLLEFSDNGLGLNLGQIVSKYDSIHNRDYSSKTNIEKANLIFDSGISTAKDVTSISGRGVGMDAVKNFVESNNGKIELYLLNEQENRNWSFQLNISLPIALKNDLSEDNMRIAG